MENKIAICSVFKDENKYVREWINYHLAIGFDYIWMYDNESKIPLSETVADYIDQGKVGVKGFKGQHHGRQVQCCQDALVNKLKDYSWIAHIDIDEFIVLLEESQNIKDYLKEYNNCSSIGLNWLMFGSNGHIETQESVISAYTQSLPSHGANKHIKSIYQPKYTKSTGAPHFVFTKSDKKLVAGGRQVNVKHKPCDRAFSEPPVLDYKMRINHYVTRSRQDFELKQKRGSGNSKNRNYSEEFWDGHHGEDVQNFELKENWNRINENITDNNDM